MSNIVQIKRNFTEMQPAQVDALVNAVARIFLNHVMEQTNTGPQADKAQPNQVSSSPQPSTSEQRTTQE